MPTPANQITLRCEPTDIKLFASLKEELMKRSVITPKDGDIHRAIYHHGLLVLLAKMETSTANGEPIEPENEIGPENDDPFNAG